MSAVGSEYSVPAALRLWNHPERSKAQAKRTTQEEKSFLGGSPIGASHNRMGL
jgi:hypothetical protein